MKLLAVDPGEKVGWATACVEPPDNALFLLDHGIHTWKDFTLKLGQVIGDYDVVIYETWRLSAKHAKHLIGSDMQSSQFIGAVRALAWLNEVKLVASPPANKTTGYKVAPAYVKKIIDGLPKAHDESHNGDALMHLAHYHWRTFV